MLKLKTGAHGKTIQKVSNMSRPTIFIHSHVRDHLRKLGNPETVEQIHHFLGRLSASPTTTGDFSQPDPRGRLMEIKFIGRQSVIFFKDPFANIIKILDIRNTEYL